VLGLRNRGTHGSSRSRRGGFSGLVAPGPRSRTSTPSEQIRVVDADLDRVPVRIRVEQQLVGVGAAASERQPVANRVEPPVPGPVFLQIRGVAEQRGGPEPASVPRTAAATPRHARSPATRRSRSGPTSASRSAESFAESDPESFAESDPESFAESDAESDTDVDTVSRQRAVAQRSPASRSQSSPTPYSPPSNGGIAMSSGTSVFVGGASPASGPCATNHRAWGPCDQMSNPGSATTTTSSWSPWLGESCGTRRRRRRRPRSAASGRRRGPRGTAPRGRPAPTASSYCPSPRRASRRARPDWRPADPDRCRRTRSDRPARSASARLRPRRTARREPAEGVAPIAESDESAEDPPPLFLPDGGRVVVEHPIEVPRPRLEQGRVKRGVQGRLGRSLLVRCGEPGAVSHSQAAASAVSTAGQSNSASVAVRTRRPSGGERRLVRASASRGGTAP